MHHSMIIRKIFLPVGSSSLIAATVVAKSEGKEDREKTMIRPRDLSLYKKPAEQSKSSESASEEESALHSAVRQTREAIWSISDELTQVTDKFNHIVETGKAHTSSTIQILRDEDNYAQRYGSIAVGGLVGFILAVRRGWFRRIVYMGTGAAAVAAVCYPEEAREYSSEALQEARHFIVVAYHFINGVTRDYVGVQLPSLPGPLNISGGGGGTPSSAALMPPPASGPSHISSVPPSPPIDVPISISGSQKKQG